MSSFFRTWDIGIGDTPPSGIIRGFSAFCISLIALTLFIPNVVSAGDCPTRQQFGDRSNNRLILKSRDGRRTLYFDDVIVVKGEFGGLTVRFPSFGTDSVSSGSGYLWGIKLRDYFPGEPGSYTAELTAFTPTGARGQLGCFSLPRLKPDSRSGIFVVETYPSSGSGTFQGHFALGAGSQADSSPGATTSGSYTGRVKTDRVIEIAKTSLGEGTFLRNEAETVAVSSGYVIRHELGNWMQFVLEGQREASSFHLDEIPPEPGVYLEDQSFGTVKFHVVEEVSPQRIVGERRVVTEEKFPGVNNLTADEARRLGRMAARYDIRQFITIPQLQSLNLPHQ